MTIRHSKVSAVPDGANADLVRPSDWNDDHVIADGYTFLRKAKVTLNNDDILGLPTTPFVVVPAPGANKTIVFFGALFRKNISLPYTDIDADAYGGIGYGKDNVYISTVVANDSGASETAWSALLNSTNMAVLFPLVQQTQNWYNKMNVQGADEYSVNQPLLFWCYNPTDFDGGDPSHTFEITTFYVVVDL